MLFAIGRLKELINSCMLENRPKNDKRGFALLDQEKQREIARAGGRAAHRTGAAHEFTPDEARQAGRKGGLAISANREHMARIGRNGGRARRGSSNLKRKTDPMAIDAATEVVASR